MTDTSKLRSFIDLLSANLDHIEIDNTYAWSGTGWVLAPGMDEHFEINYIFRGSTTLTLAGVRYDAKPGDLFFFNNVYGTAWESGVFTAAFIAIRLKASAPQLLKSLMSDVFSRFCKGISPLRKDTVERLLFELIREYSGKKLGYEIYCRTLLLEIMIEILRTEDAPRSPDYALAKHADMVSAIILRITENLGGEFPLKTLATRYNMTPTYLNRVFRAFTGYSVLQYCDNMKIEKAKRLLASGGMTLLEIALELDFESGQYLGRFFKKHTGITPGEYRRLAKKGEQAAV